MKKINFVIAAFLLSFTCAAQALEISDLVGTYQSVARLEGRCSPAIKIEHASFLNSKGPAMAIYTTNNDDPHHIVFQFHSLNAGRNAVLEENPMTGRYTGWYISNHSLRGSVLAGETKVVNLLGMIIWRDTILATLNGDSLEYTRTDYNTLSQPVVNTTDRCVYRRVK